MSESGERTVPPGALAPQRFFHWGFSSAGLEVHFLGRLPQGSSRDPESALSAVEGAPARIAWLRQRHSATALVAHAGPCGDGDGLWTNEPDLALCIVTADCVPIVCGSRHGLAAIHAGWRGLVGGVIEVTVDALRTNDGALEAWLGPAIGSCCYEVGEDVAAKVVAASSPDVRSLAQSGRPHLDLHHAAETQLRALGVREVHRVPSCTKCHPELLWSYRASRGAHGRNYTLAWLTS